MRDQRLPRDSGAIDFARRGLKDHPDDPFTQLHAELSCRNRKEQLPDREAHSMRQPHAADAVIIQRRKDFRCCEFQSVKIIIDGELEPGTVLYDHTSGKRVDPHVENVGMVEQSTL